MPRNFRTPEDRIAQLRAHGLIRPATRENRIRAAIDEIGDRWFLSREIADMTGIEVNNVSGSLGRLIKKGELVARKFRQTKRRERPFRGPVTISNVYRYHRVPK